jgi:predicted LPLAT superfamily acyltransferase
MQKKIIVKKRGNSIGLYFFKVFLKTGGLKLAYGLLHLVCIHYLLFDRQAKKGALAYLKRRFPNKSSLTYQIKIYKLFVSQGKQLIDRSATLSNSVEFDFVRKGRDVLDQLACSSKGAVLLTAHVGNWQIALSPLQTIGKKVFLVMRPEDNKALKKALNISGVDDVIDVISPEGHLGGVVQIMNVLRF